MTPSRFPIRVVVVGAGASGTLVAARLLESTGVPLRVTLVDSSESRFGRGLAYREGPAVHPLNVRARGMSAYEDRPADFVDYLASRIAHAGERAYGEDDFVPRALYGRYLREVLERAEASSAHELEVIVDHAVDVVPEGDRYGVILASSARVLAAEAVVLAIGHGAADLEDEHARGPGHLDAVTRTDDVLFVGSGLTTVDHLLELDARGHRGRVYVVSRHGLWPRPHGEPSEEAALTDLHAHVASPRTLLGYLRRLARDEARSWQAVVDALRPHVPRIWSGWDPRERAAFLRHARPYWEVHRHRIPAESAALLERLRALGRLSTWAGSVVASHPGPDGRFVSRIEGRDGSHRIVETRAVVRCTGPMTDYRSIRHPLVRRLVARGWLVPDRHRLGFETAEDGRLVREDGGIAEALFTLGPPRRAALYESTGLPEIRRQAGELAEAIVRKAALVVPLAS